MRKNRYAKLALLVCVSLLVGCGSLSENRTGDFNQIARLGIASEAVRGKLYNQFYAWQGVRYRLGGLNKQGIDCSGFVHVTFKSKLGIVLPRTTKLQSRIGKQVRKKDLMAGDLVFFKTGFSFRHVGIYLEDNKFLHASTSKGVIISRLDNVYWKSNYWKSIRI